MFVIHALALLAQGCCHRPSAQLAHHVSKRGVPFFLETLRPWLLAKVANRSFAICSFFMERGRLVERLSPM
jgi:hypothetical protein